jgi:hypothetical protein
MPSDDVLFTYSVVVYRSRYLGCDQRTYRKELRNPGSVRGITGIAIRGDIERQRRLLALSYRERTKRSAAHAEASPK